MNKLQSRLPPFPRPAPSIPDLIMGERFEWAAWECRHRQNLEKVLLPFWQGMQVMYAAILADNAANADDGLTLSATVEYWPESVEAQQHALVGLMDKSKLRDAWRSLAHWESGATASELKESVVSAKLQKEFTDSARPMREIPLYKGYGRASCQQVICLPLRQWNAMFSEADNYAPTSIENDIVEKLSTRLARALNAPLQSIEDINAAPSLEIWDTNPRALVVARDNHGMYDHLFDEYLRPRELKPNQTPTWRFDGFYGQLRVAGIGDESWYVTVLAPSHFVGTLVAWAREYEPL